jgi:2-deoxy-D-gluconate 3-dehydrogenase
MKVLDSFKVDGKVAIVTGCARPNGLGYGMAEALAEAGANIVGVDVGPLTDTEKRMRELGVKFYGVQADLTKPAERTRLIQEAKAKMGRIDILINNAGIIRRAPALDFSEKDWDDVIEVNLKAAFFLAQAAGRTFVDQGTGGKIVNTASMLSFQGGIIVPSYTASKSAIAGITRALANEWAKYRINVNAIAPGYMATDNTAPLRADAARSSAILERIPAGRWGENSDLKGAVVFLSSAASDYVNGHILAVDGGWLAR